MKLSVSLFINRRSPSTAKAIQSFLVQPLNEYLVMLSKPSIIGFWYQLLKSLFGQHTALNTRLARWGWMNDDIRIRKGFFDGKLDSVGNIMRSAKA